MRRCILHVGPGKTGTSSIQSALKENAAILRERGILVPASGRDRNGSHLGLARALAGLPLKAEYATALAEFEQEIRAEPSGTVVISSEFLSPIFSIPGKAERAINKLKSLGLEVAILLYARNQPQRLNSAYTQGIKRFRHSADFEPFVRQAIERQFDRFSYGWWKRLAESYRVELIARPFTKDAQKHGLIQDFLAAVGASGSEAMLEEKRKNEAAGPLTVAVARTLLRKIGGADRLTQKQANRCAWALRECIGNLGVQDGNYCGLTTSLARMVEAEYARDNDEFAWACWNQPWSKVFGSEVGVEHHSNDYAVTGVPTDREASYKQALAEMDARIQRVLKNKTLAEITRWNRRLTDRVEEPL